MRHLCAGVLLTWSFACWAGTPRISSPPAVGVAVDPATGHLVAIEGVAGRLSHGRLVWEGPVESVWPAASRAIVRSGANWQLLEFTGDLVVSRVIELGERDWVNPVWNSRGTAWLACDESAEHCGVYSAENGAQTREIRSTGRLGAIAFSDNGVDALLRQGDRAVLWTDSDGLVPIAEGTGFGGAFSSDGTRIAVIDEGGALVLADVRSAGSTRVEAPAGAVGIVWVGESVVSVHRSGEIQRWDARGDLVSASQCECQPTGAWVAGQGMVRLHDSLKQMSHYLDFGRGEATFTILPAAVSEVQ